MLRTGKLWITYPESETAPISEEDMAAVAVVALTTDKLINEVIPLCGPVSMSQRQQFEAINRIREKGGLKAIELVVLEPVEWKEMMKKVRGEAYDEEFVDSLIRWWKENDKKPEMIQSSERITGKKSQSYEKWLEVNKDAFLRPWYLTSDGKLRRLGYAVLDSGR